MNEQPERLSQGAYARRRGWSQQYVSQLIKAGKIPTDNGKIDPEAADKALATIREPNRKAVVDANDKRRGTAAYPPGNLELDLDQQTVTKAKVRRENIAADRDEIVFRKMVGELVDKGRYDAAVQTILSEVREQVMNLANLLAGEIAAESDVRKVHAMIHNRCIEICNNAADRQEAVAEQLGATSQ